MGILTALTVAAVLASGAAGDGWKAGVARIDITPAEPMWLAGYAARDHEAEGGTLHPLWVKALALEDAAGNRALIVTSDVLGFPKPVSDNIFDRLQASTGLDRVRIILNSSHTHSGPVIDGSLLCIYPLDSAALEKVRRYTPVLVDKVVSAGEAAFKDMAPVRLESANGVTRFAVNRRNNKEAEIATTYNLNGPVDHAVPVLRVSREDGQPLAVLFGYACHNTTLCEYEWCGDYAGFAQEILEKAHPGATALFFQGCGANQNPIPRRTLSLARQYGAELAAAVEAAMAEPMTPLDPALKTARTEVELFLETPPDRAALVKITETDNEYNRRAATEMIAQLDAGQPLRTSYMYPVQVWNLGGLPLVTFAGEIVVDYAIHAKNILGPRTFVMGYSNILVSYIPTAAIIREGGYEGGGAQLMYGMPNKWREDIETRIVETISAVAKQAGLL
ncbi:MAG TPA: neutral/alkaline non-lysosomal ceramidase N-terminal domain-containing protein [Candidatus Bathyarchaeia archaeon]|nr:neutral/alkaline non-lysosomal ceramidase N-terminal domain-containing protein [Candidatus Bathyarchaeia archaeon]